MSTDKRWVLERVPTGEGIALDLGGGTGELSGPLRRLGYSYLNLDFDSRGGELTLRGDAMALPLKSGSVTLVVSSDSLEHFRYPERALAETRRVLAPEGQLVVWVPFMHPFHGDDFFRFTPLGLQTLLTDAGFELHSIENPLWAASVVIQGVVSLTHRFGLQRLEPSLERAAAWLDVRLGSRRRQAAAFAAAYLVVAKPTSGGAGGSTGQSDVAL